MIFQHFWSEGSGIATAKWKHDGTKIITASNNKCVSIIDIVSQQIEYIELNEPGIIITLNVTNNFDGF